MQKAKAAPSSNKFDIVLWIAVIAMVVAMVVGNIYFSSYAVSIRLAALIVMGIVALYLAYLTSKGKWVWSFLKDSRNEMRKVVWPNRQETTRTTMMVIAIVVVMSLIVWGVDSLFALFVSSIVM